METSINKKNVWGIVPDNRLEIIEWTQEKAVGIMDNPSSITESSLSTDYIVTSRKRIALWDNISIPFGTPKTTILQVILENATKEIGFWKAVWRAGSILNTVMKSKGIKMQKVPTSQNDYAILFRWEWGKMTQREFLRELPFLWVDVNHELKEQLAWVFEEECDSSIDDLYYPEEYRMITGYDPDLPKKWWHETHFAMLKRMTLDEKQRYFWWAIHIPFVLNNTETTFLQVILKNAGEIVGFWWILLAAQKELNPILENIGMPIIPRDQVWLAWRLKGTSSITHTVFLQTILALWGSEDKNLKETIEQTLWIIQECEEASIPKLILSQWDHLLNRPQETGKYTDNSPYSSSWTPTNMRRKNSGFLKLERSHHTTIDDFRQKFWNKLPEDVPQQASFILQGLKKVTDSFLDGSLSEIAKIWIVFEKNTIIISFPSGLSQKLTQFKWIISEIFTPGDMQMKYMKYDVEIRYE